MKLLLFLSVTICTTVCVSMSMPYQVRGYGAGVNARSPRKEDLEDRAASLQAVADKAWSKCLEVAYMPTLAIPEEKLKGLSEVEFKNFQISTTIAALRNHLRCVTDETKGYDNIVVEPNFVVIPDFRKANPEEYELAPRSKFWDALKPIPYSPLDGYKKKG
ncbi:unnamed protein product [Tenebrio molitor]|nr:unnamed protein product [Tenebrio molitor]